ncbi:RNA polymerase sigma factor [Solitalea lacus]|uniref:RNA polymerase sigma factor n=1 Tax=Solitalea lacus TaxID=2911172 RepID=UPI001EDC1F8E|nr:RNA polymerase sigma-70 factor [Solitalea lacus]UKJ06886.1 RNA polymerase sigma-70 factor [Solitalea lacus]
MAEQENIHRLKSGSVRSFEELYESYHKRLYAYFLQRTKSDDLSQELVQQSFIKLWRNTHKLSDDYPVSVQLFRIARSVMIDELRRLANERKALEEFTQSSQIIKESENLVFSKYLQEEINEAINDLPPIRKKVFQLSRMNGHSHKEIAAELSISSKTVEDHISKAVKQLRKILKYSLFIF